MIDATTAWTLIVALTAATVALKAVGPLMTGGRAMASRPAAVIALMPATLLAALVVTSTLADDDGDYTAGADAVGVLVGAAVVWRTGAVLWAVLLAPAVTAGLRLTL